MNRTGTGVAVPLPLSLGGSFVCLGHCLTSLLWITPRYYMADVPPGMGARAGGGIPALGMRLVSRLESERFDEGLVGVDERYVGIVSLVVDRLDVTVGVLVLFYCLFLFFG